MIILYPTELSGRVLKDERSWTAPTLGSRVGIPLGAFFSISRWLAIGRSTVLGFLPNDCRGVAFFKLILNRKGPKVTRAGRRKTM